MINTTYNKLQKLKRNGSSVELFPVRYVHSLSIDEELKSLFSVNGRANLSDLFKSKRESFLHEGEYRACFSNFKEEFTGSHKETAKILLKDGARNFIDGVLVHPLANPDFVLQVKDFCAQNSISFLGQSELYKFTVSFD